VRFLTMELIEGATLAERLHAGPLDTEEAFRVSAQIAQALGAAHGKGIIHRDLKPANIKITPEDQVKVLDFGLAKAYVEEERAGEESPDLTESPTLADATRAGIILGTAAYMSPEQARGKPLDKRTDIWSFGCVLYEMLTGQKAFSGETVSDHVAKILQSEPDWEALPEATPGSVRTLLRRCLAKDPKRRMHDMGDVWLEIEEIPEAAAREEAAREALARSAMEPVVPWRRALPWALAVLAVAVVVILAVWPRGATPDRPVRRLSLPTQTLALGTHPCSSIIELSPDGSMMAYVSGDGGLGQIYLQSLDSYEPVAVEGAEMARAPFFSPDGQWLGFEAEGRLWKVPVEGGKAWPICEAIEVHGANWTDDGMIIYGTGEGSLRRVSSDGGEPEVLTEADWSQDEIWLLWPEVLPNGEDVLFAVVNTDGRAVKVDLLSTSTGERRTVLEGGSNTRYLPTGHLLYAVDGSLMAVRFDADQGEIVGSPEPVIDGVLMGFPWEIDFAHFTVADNGTLVYVSGPIISTTTSLVRVDRKGAANPIGESLADVQGPRFSPDGRCIAVSARPDADQDSHIWVRDLERDTFTPLTFDRTSWWPVWTPDGERIATPSYEPEIMGAVYWMPADGSSPPERLIYGNEYPQSPLDWSPDGGTLVLQQQMHPETASDILIFRPGEDDEARPILEGSYDEYLADLSPDGRWLAYSSNETGQEEVFVRSFPDLGDKWQISTDGGAEPVWSPDGTELYYRTDEGRRIMVVDVVTEPSFSPGSPRLLFTGDFVQHMGFGRNYDIAPDGQSFVMVKQDLGGVEEADVRVILNWFEELKRLVPTER
jgi:serine/threonine-protein kinase